VKSFSVRHIDLQNFLNAPRKVRTSTSESPHQAMWQYAQSTLHYNHSTLQTILCQ